MAHVGRRVLNALALLSLVIAVAALSLWVASYCVRLAVSRERLSAGDGTTTVRRGFTASSEAGRLWIRHVVSAYSNDRNPEMVELVHERQAENVGGGEVRWD